MASNVATVQQEKQRRPRKTNWSNSEIIVLTERVEEKLDLIRSKFSDSVTNAKKNAAWLEITEAVNAVGVAYRTVQEVRDKWKNMTSTAKKEFSDFGKEQRKTGGGPAPKKPSAATAKIIEIFKETASFTGLSGFETNPGKIFVVPLRAQELLQRVTDSFVYFVFFLIICYLQKFASAHLFQDNFVRYLPTVLRNNNNNNLGLLWICSFVFFTTSPTKNIGSKFSRPNLLYNLFLVVSVSPNSLALSKSSLHLYQY